jgi:hypothetical protein
MDDDLEFGVDGIDHVAAKKMRTELETLETLVHELVEGGVDRIALNKTLGILRASDNPLEKMERLENFWWEISYREELIAKLEALPTMSQVELDAVRWFDECLDCRVRAWVDLHEDFYVHDHVWRQAVPDGEGMLCIGCLETRLGRKLMRDDFTVPEKQLSRKSSARLVDRLHCCS